MFGLGCRDKWLLIGLACSLARRGIRQRSVSKRTLTENLSESYLRVHYHTEIHLKSITIGRLSPLFALS